MPRLSSSLQERASGPQRTTAPKTEPIMIAGPAGRGPTGEVVEIENADDAFQTFGTSGPLAYEVAAALRGARVGSRAADNRRFGLVKAVRTETGEPAELTLTDGGGNPVIELETASSGEQANDWSVVEQNNQYHIEEPEGTEVTSFAVDASAFGVEDTITTPSELAAAIRNAFAGRLNAEAQQHEAHFELSLDRTVSAISINSTDTRTEIDFSGVTNQEMLNNSSGGITWIGGKGEYFANPSSTMEAHRRVLAPDNEDARIYAITAGAPVAAPAGNRTVTVPNLADASVVGTGDTDTLLNIRTDGSVGAGNPPNPVPLTDAAERDGSVVSEGYFRARRQYAGRLDVTNTVSAEASDAAFTPAVAAEVDPSGDIGSGNASDLSYDGQDVASGDIVLIFGQGSDTDGLYNVATDNGDTAQYLESSRHRTASFISGEILDVQNGTENSGTKVYSVSSNDLSDAKMIKVTFEAPAGIADDAGSLAESYVESKIDTSNPSASEIDNPSASEIEKFSSDRLTGEDTGTFFNEYGKAVKLEMAPVTDEDNVHTISYSDPSSTSGGNEVGASIDWSDGSGEVLLNQVEFQELYGADFDDGFVYFSYDSCITDLTEVGSENQLNPNADEIQFAVDGFDLTFNQELPHDLVVRGLTVHQYRIGQDVQVERTDTGNKFIFTDGEAQPGEAGDAIGYLETIVGFDYRFEPDFPTVPTKQTFDGGSTGVNASDEEKTDALRTALEELPSEDFSIIVPAGLSADAMTTAADPVTGVPSEEPVGVLDVLEDHRDRQDYTGASGVAFLNVEEMEASDASGNYSSAQKRQRSQEILGTGGTGEITTGSIVQESSRPQFYFFDAPMAANIGGQSVRLGGAAFFAGVRAALPNDTALYEVELPTDLYRPIYRYDVGRQLPERLGNEGRVNTWDVDTGALTLATEVTGAGRLQGSDGELADSNLQSGVVMFATQKFRTNLEDELSNLIGGMQAGGVETLRATAESLIRGTVNRTTGVIGLNDFEPQRDIQIQAEGGSSIGLYINLQAVVLGELTRIDLTVGSITQTEARTQDQESPIPQAQ